MAPITKTKSAFGFFQAQNLGKIKNELKLSMGDAMKELSTRWKALSKIDREPFFQLEAEDRERFQQESALADAEAFADQEKRRDNLVAKDGEGVSMRGERKKIAEEREMVEDDRKRRKARIEADTDPEILAERRRVKQQKKQEALERQKKRDGEEQKLKARHNKLDKDAKKKQAKRLEYLLEQSSIFGKLQSGKGSANDAAEEDDKKGEGYVPHHLRGGDEKKSKSKKKVEVPVPEGEGEDSEDEKFVFLSKQPDCIKFGNLKPYQLEGLNWMIHLAEKGLNGILADEMGLGKTLQSISILAYYYEFLKIQGPHLVCVPKSTLSNWMNELKRWCPSLRAIKFHGNKDDRADLIHNYFTNDAAAHDGKRPDRQVVDPKTGELIDDNSENPRAWDVCVTTYEVCNTEKQALSKFGWKYLVIDEAHRLKNEASLFSNTVRTFSTTHRLLLTGTPLQNNLHELWALLNFLLPDIFSSADQFDEWFDLETDDADAKQEMISQLHKVLRPFMLRRLKADVAKGLPPKTETLVMVGMSSMQKRLYKQLLLRDIDSITSTNNSNRTAVLNIVMQLRKCCGHPYLFEGVEDRTLDPLGEHLVENCGKLFMVDKLLKRLKERGSRVLIFTQMTRVLDILEDYMVMRGYKYCRIDGNTDYSVRESSIDDFNAPNSEKFCFILSTRAGGLGINLQTADICILYDSDWNPQADLQAQDRCHRLGQKKPVNVYRLVSENTVEEKIVERAQQKLKLDAMVVQQGRLKDKDKGISKDEIMAAVRFGADTIFRSEESTITDDDIDVILERGAAKTKELAEKITKAEKGDLLDFRLDGGISAQTFEGIDYSDRDLRTQLKLLAADSIGKRERRAPPTNYNPVVEPKKSMVVNNRKIKLPKVLRLPRMEDHQFYNRDRLLELSKIEFQTFATLKQNGGLPPREDYETKQSVLSDELAQEKLELLAEGFEDWTKSQYFHFVKAATKFGRTDIGSIAADMDLAVESVDAYSQAFWAYGASELKEEEWERALNSITKGEEKIAKQRHQRTLLQQYVSTFDNPRTEMSFANKGTVHFASEQDRALLCAVDKYGTENLDEVRETILNDDALLFQHPTQSMSNDAISKRVAYRMRQMVKELDAREKKMNTVKPPQVIAAEEAIKGIKEMDLWESNAFEAELRGAAPPPMQFSSNEIKSSMEERLRDRQVVIERFREIEIQLRGCRDIATKTHEGIMRGDQYVNYSNITLKAGGQHITENGTLTDLDGVDMEAYVSQAVLAVPQCGECQSCLDPKARKLCAKRLEVREAKIKEFDVKLREWVEDGATRTKTLEKDRKDGNRQYWPRKRGSDAFSGKPVVAGKDNGTSVFKKKISPPGNPLGNKKMSVPDELLPFLCKRVTAEGTRKRMQVIQDFSKEHPAVSIRQVTFKFTDITTKDRPACVPEAEKPKGKGRAFIFYLRPRFYNLLPEDERPKNWEPCAQEDELLYQEEKKKFKEEKAKKDKSMKDMMDKTMSTQAEESSIATGTSQDLLDGKIMSQDDDDGKILSQDDDQDDDDDGKIMSQDDDDDQDDGKIMSQDDDDEMTEDESEPPIKKMKY